MIRVKRRSADDGTVQRRYTGGVDAGSGGRWWGAFGLPEGATGRWNVGPLSFWIEHLPEEWRVLSAPAPDPSTTTCDLALPCRREDTAPPTATVRRIPVHKRSDDVQIVPALPDRSVVERPQTPLLLLPGEEVTIYVSTPLWVRILVGKPPREVVDLATQRTSDTWFGPNTIQGELCYSGWTHARLRLEYTPLRASRALTAVRVENQALEPMPLERIKLPVLNLSLFADPEGHLWTESVTMTRQSDGSARVDFSERPPPEAKQAEPIAGPRVKGGRNLLVRAFNALLG